MESYSAPERRKQFHSKLKVYDKNPFLCDCKNLEL